MPMPATRQGWVELFQTLGEEVPKTWTLAQLKAHWEDVKPKANHLTLEYKLKELKKASRKKGNLMEFLQVQGISFNPSMTIAQMMNLGEKEITQLFEPTDEEFVGFGKHGNLTYIELYEKHPSYLVWAKKEVMESDDPGWRLERLVRWYSQMSAKARVPNSKVKSTSKLPEVDQLSQGSFSMVSENHGLQEERAEIEKMRHTLMMKMQEVEAKEKELDQEKEEMQLSENRHKNRKEM
eukprot:s2436_g4.t1